MTGAVSRMLATIVVAMPLGGCWPALKVVQPRAEVVVTDATGQSVEGADVTVVRANVFPNVQVVIAEAVTDARGTVKLPARLKWHIQAMLPDAVTSYSWAYCVEKSGYVAATAPLERWHGPHRVVLERTEEVSTCVLPDDEYPLLRVSNELR